MTKKKLKKPAKKSKPKKLRFHTKPKEDRTPEEQETYLKKLGKVFEELLKGVVKDMVPFKCFIILTDHEGNGSSFYSEDFTIEEFKQYAEAIFAKNDLLL